MLNVLATIRAQGELRNLPRLRVLLVKPIPVAVSPRDVRDLVSFRVYLVMQDAIDLCSHVIADQGWGPVPSLRDHFAVLADKGVLPSDLADRLSAGVKLRNLVGRGYAEVDPAKMRAAAGELATLVDPFCSAILAFAESHPS